MEKTINELQTQVKNGKVKTEKMHTLVQRYRDIDADAREVHFTVSKIEFFFREIPILVLISLRSLVVVSIGIKSALSRKRKRYFYLPPPNLTLPIKQPLSFLYPSHLIKSRERSNPSVAGTAYKMTVRLLMLPTSLPTKI